MRIIRHNAPCDALHRVALTAAANSHTALSPRPRTVRIAWTPSKSLPGRKRTPSPAFARSNPCKGINAYASQWPYRATTPLVWHTSPISAPHSPTHPNPIRHVPAHPPPPLIRSSREPPRLSGKLAPGRGLCTKPFLPFTALVGLFGCYTRQSVKGFCAFGSVGEPDSLCSAPQSTQMSKTRAGRRVAPPGPVLEG